MTCNDNCWPWFNWCPSTLTNVFLGIGIAAVIFLVIFIVEGLIFWWLYR